MTQVTILTLLVIIFTLSSHVVHAEWVNLYDGKLDFECPTGQAISYIKSIHSNKKEDRRWDFQCRLLDGTQTNCKWSGYVNKFDGAFTYQCDDKGYIAGVKSYHDNKTEDRRHRFKCCEQTGSKVINDCNDTGYTKYDSLFTYTVPQGYIWRGLQSQHKNDKEDRIFKFSFCRLG